MADNPSRRAPAGGATVEVAIERLAHGGAGIARHAGQVLFVPGALPGDRARVAVTGLRRRHLEGRIVELLGPSPARVVAPCAYAARCGGCGWLALQLGHQRRARAELVREALARIGGLEAPAEIPVVAADAPHAAPGLAYRSRIEVALGPAGPGGARAVGFRAAASHEVVDVERCVVASPPLDAALAALRRAARAGEVPPGVGEVEIAVGDDPARVVATARLARPLPAGKVSALADRLAGAWPGLAGLRVEGPRPPEPGAEPPAEERGDPRLTVTAPGPGGRPLPLEVPAGVFMQANAAVNARLVEAVTAALAPSPGARLLDLYCGAGNFSLPLAAAGADVLGFETDGRAVEAARRSAARLGLAGARFRQVDVAEGLAWAAADGAVSPVGLVLDPPRAGAGPLVVDRIAVLGPARIAYVSCEPSTLARDLARLAARRYVLAGLAVFDMFPQTPHVETLVTLHRA